MLALEKVCVRKLYWNMHHERTVGLVRIELKRKTYLVSVFLRRNWKLSAMFHHKLSFAELMISIYWNGKKVSMTTKHHFSFKFVFIFLKKQSSNLFMKETCAKWWFDLNCMWDDSKMASKTLDCLSSINFFCI